MFFENHYLILSLYMTVALSETTANFAGYPPIDFNIMLYPTPHLLFNINYFRQPISHYLSLVNY